MTTTDSQLKAAYQEMLEEYGDRDAIPRDALAVWQERGRAMYILDANPDVQGAAQVNLLRGHGVLAVVIEELTYGIDPEDLVQTAKRAKRQAALERWLKDNPGTAITAAQLAERSGFSLSWANKFIREQVYFFRKIAKGQYEVRDVIAERAAAK